MSVDIHGDSARYRIETAHGLGNWKYFRSFMFIMDLHMLDLSLDDLPFNVGNYLLSDADIESRRLSKLAYDTELALNQLKGTNNDN